MKSLSVSFCLLNAVFMVSNVCQAHCIEDDWVLLRAQTTQVGACTAGDPLTLDTKEVSYPLMSHNPYTVEYWRGSFVRIITTQYQYLHLILDKCNPKDDVILSERVNSNRNSPLAFSIENPNLKDSVKATYELLPMTDSEAQTALIKARLNCEQYRP